MKQFLSLITLLATFVGYAHQSDLSTSVFSKTADGKYVLQIISSLTAFEGEIDYLYSKNAYKTADAFNNLVIDHLKKNVFFIINEKDTLRFSNPIVILGHETKLVVELLGVPNEIKSIYFQNAMFKDMPHNQMALIMLPEGFPKEQYILENSNKQAIHLELNQGKWFPVESDIQIFQAKNTVYLFLLLSFVIILVLFFKDSTKVFK